jgi:hypothetical protein
VISPPADNPAIRRRREVLDHREAPPRPLLPLGLHRGLHRDVGRRVAELRRRALLPPDRQADQVRDRHQATVRHQRTEELRLSRSGSGDLRRQLLLRMLLEHVLQRVQVHALQTRAQVSSERPVRRANHRRQTPEAGLAHQPDLSVFGASVLPQSMLLRTYRRRLQIGPQAWQTFLRRDRLHGLLRSRSQRLAEHDRRVHGGGDVDQAQEAAQGGRGAAARLAALRGRQHRRVRFQGEPTGEDQVGLHRSADQVSLAPQRRSLSLCGFWYEVVVLGTRLRSARIPIPFSRANATRSAKRRATRPEGAPRPPHRPRNRYKTNR